MVRAYNLIWVCSRHPWRCNIRKKGRGKTSTAVLKTGHQKHRSWQLYSNEKNGWQQFQMESCQPIKRLKVKKKKEPWTLETISVWNVYLVQTTCEVQ